jgi:hypothetical protein
LAPTFAALGSPTEFSGDVTLAEPFTPTGPICSLIEPPSWRLGAFGTFTLEPAFIDTDGPNPIPNSGIR